MSHNPSYSGVKRASDAPRALQQANKRVKAHGDAPPVRHAKDAGCALSRRPCPECWRVASAPLRQSAPYCAPAVGYEPEFLTHAPSARVDDLIDALRYGLVPSAPQMPRIWGVTIFPPTPPPPPPT